MDFSSILHAAQKNDKFNSNGGNYYKTKFEPPKKECKSKTLSSNIQKFLQKKEEEERLKVEEAKRKRDELTSKRDVKATNKIKKMLKVIKSANKSVLAEAVDNVNTAVTMHGPEQPDEDDYGYVSQEASAFYSKMMEKYKTIPDEDKKFSKSKKSVSHDLLSTKDRVRAAIMRHQEEESMPHKRKRRSRHSPDGHPSSPNDYVEETKQPEKKDEKPKHKRPAPPPLDFNELLKIAEKKQFEPVVVETKKSEKVDEVERLMTKRQKKEFEEQKAHKEARLRREQEKSKELVSRKVMPKNSRPDVNNQQSKPANPMSIRIPKLSDKINSASPTNSKSSNSNAKNNSSEGKLVHSDLSPKLTSGKKEDARYNEKKPDVNKNFKKPLDGLVNDPKKVKPQQNVPQRPTAGLNLNKSKNGMQDLKKNIPGNQKRPEKIEIIASKSLVDSKQHLNRSKVAQPPQRGESDARKVQLELSNKNAIDSKNKNMLTSKLDRKLLEQRGKLTGIETTNPQKSSTIKKPVPSINAKGGRPNQLDNKDRQMSSNTGKGKQGPTSIKGNKPIGVSNTKPSPVGDSKGVRQFPPSDVRGVRQFPPADLKKPRQFPPPDVRGPRQFPPQDMKSRREKLALGKRKILDDDSEYDSELDDFIDDGPEDGGNDYSKYIKEIFGYDKSRYRDADDDDRNMESNFSQVMREEYISKKIGIMEDLEDMKMEALEKKKNKNKRRRIDD